MKIVLAKWAGAIAALAAAIFLNVTASHAGLYGNSRWCAVSNQGSDALNWDCEYDTAADCAPAVITGNRGFCAINPYWRPATNQN